MSTTDHYLDRHPYRGSYGDRPSPWQVEYTCGGCGEELWSAEEGRGTTVGTPEEALQDHPRAEARIVLAERLNRYGWTCGRGGQEPGEYARCDERTTVCDELAGFLLTNEYVEEVAA